MSKKNKSKIKLNHSSVHFLRRSLGLSTNGVTLRDIANAHAKRHGNDAEISQKRAREYLLSVFTSPDWVGEKKQFPPLSLVAKKTRNIKHVFANTGAFLQSYEWRRVRMVVLKRDGRRCVCCGATPETGAVMNVDHIKPRKTHPELALDESNLQVLCGECNHGKGNWDTTDWRETETLIIGLTDVDQQNMRHLRNIT